MATLKAAICFNVQSHFLLAVILSWDGNLSKYLGLREEVVLVLHLQNYIKTYKDASNIIQDIMIQMKVRYKNKHLFPKF